MPDRIAAGRPSLATTGASFLEKHVHDEHATSFHRVTPLLAAGTCSLNRRQDTLAMTPRIPERQKIFKPHEGPFSPLMTQDILGAFVSPRWERYAGRRPVPDPIDGGKPLDRYPPFTGRRPVDLSLCSLDIEYCQPKSRNHIVTTRCLEPVAPRYKMPSSEAPAPLVPKGSPRDLNFIGDIEFTSPSPRIPFLTSPPRDLMNKNLLPNAPKYGRNGFSASLFAKDVNYPKGERSPERVSSSTTLEGQNKPLDPVYWVPLVPGATSIAHTWEEESRAQLSTPKPEWGLIGGVEEHKEKWSGCVRDNGEPQLSLIVKDIPGTVSQKFVGHMPWSGHGVSKNKPKFHDVQDVRGAQADTIPTVSRTRASRLARAQEEWPP